MSIEIVIPPLNVSESSWSSLPLSERALLVAAQECDVYHTTEEPRYSNRGPRVDAMLRAARCTPGNPWCAAFVAWCCANAGWNPVSEMPGNRVMYPAAVISWVAWARRTRRLKDDSPARGDLFYYDLPGETHIGFVTHAEPDLIETLEGNTNAGGSREGYEVARRTRPAGSPTGYITLRALPVRQ
jgi:hypothetical protein